MGNTHTGVKAQSRPPSGPITFTPTTENDTFLVVGAGIFGASTALHLIRRYPNASVKLLDREPFPCKLGASWDWNKIIRAEYSDLFYMKLALEAKQLWETDPMFKPFYHEPGAVWIQDTDLAETIANNYEKLGLPGIETQRYSVPEARKIYDGLFEHADFTAIEKVLVTPATGWAEAAKALDKVIQTAVREGVTYLCGDAKKLAFDDSGTCVGVHTAGDQTITASRVILCTGAYTAKLLADSAPHWKELHAGRRFIAAGMATALMTPEAEACERFKGVPTVLHERLHHEGRGGFIPPTPDGSFKWWADITFTRLSPHESGEKISYPPDVPFQGQWDVPPPFRAEMERGRELIFGDKADRFGFDKYRLCWDAISRTDDFFVCPHPAAKNLYLATIGSFHSFKFLPNIGKYVVNMLEGKLDDEQSRRWKWDREEEDGEGGHGYWPKRDWADFVKKVS